MSIPVEVLTWARAHHGLVTAAVWLAHGGSRSSFHRAVRSGVLVPVTTGVVVLRTTPVGPTQRIAAAVLRHGPDVIVSHRSACWLWGAPIAPGDTTHLITTRRHHRTNDDAVVVHHPADRTGLHAARRRGLPVSTPVRAALDLAAMEPVEAVTVIESFVRDGHLTMRSLRAAVERTRRRGHPWVRSVTEALDHIGPVVTDSELETAMRSIFRRAGLRGWVFHARVEGHEVDICFAHERVIVEVDGWEDHVRRRSGWEHERERDLLLQAVGWTVVHLTWRMVTRRPEACVARLRSTLAVRSP